MIKCIDCDHFEQIDDKEFECLAFEENYTFPVERECFCSEFKEKLAEKESKYKSKKTIVDGIKFDSKIESEYYLNLKSMEACGGIVGFELQPTYELQPKFKENGVTIRAVNYVADFEVCYPDGSVVVIDIKGFPTAVAKLKRKMFIYKYPRLAISWMVYVKKHGGWIDYFELQKIRRKNKKLKEI